MILRPELSAAVSAMGALNIDYYGLMSQNSMGTLEKLARCGSLSPPGQEPPPDVPRLPLLHVKAVTFYQKFGYLFECELKSSYSSCIDLLEM